MPIKVKFDITGKGDEAWGSTFTKYEGPTPPKGSYVCRVKRMVMGHIAKEGENKGKPRINVLLEVVGGQGSNGIDDPEYQYLGAPIWDGLNIIKSQTGRVNAFLHALTDGEENSKRAVETAFWPPNGPKAEKVAKKGEGATGHDIHITDIGKYHIGSPDGEQLVRVVTKMGKNLEDEPRAEVNNYLPYTGPKTGAASPPKSNGVSADADGIIDADVVDDGIEVMDAGDYLGALEEDGAEIIEGELVDSGEPPF